MRRPSNCESSHPRLERESSSQIGACYPQSCAETVARALNVLYQRVAVRDLNLGFSAAYRPHPCSHDFDVPPARVIAHHLPQGVHGFAPTNPVLIERRDFSGRTGDLLGIGWPGVGVLPGSLYRAGKVPRKSIVFGSDQKKIFFQKFPRFSISIRCPAPLCKSLTARPSSERTRRTHGLLLRVMGARHYRRQ